MPSAVPPGEAVAGWMAAWVGSGLSATALLIAAGVANDGDASPSVGWLAASAVVQWAALLAVTVYLVRRHGSGRLTADLGLRMRPIDLLGIPAGVVAQVGLVPLVYAPLRAVWPGTFDTDEIERRARDLWESAQGGGAVLLVAIVVLGAPLVEEVVYRGLLQSSFSARLGRLAGWAIGAALFAVIHLQAVEIPGLLVAGLVFGAGLLLTGRLGASVLAHMAFNAAGLVLVAR
ncbi:MAG: lysostaphin resistance A-like protein [Ilumatobacteraceae bacterium]